MKSLSNGIALNEIEKNSILNRKDIFPDLEILDGPLQSYRAKSSFDWRKLRLIVEDEEILKLRYKIWNFIEENSLFSRTHLTLPVDEQRHIATKRMFAIRNEQFLTDEDLQKRPDLAAKYITSLLYYDPNLCIKISLGFGMFPDTIKSLGNGKILDLLEGNKNMENVGCFALTEIGHGTNVKGMKTTATYDIDSKSFILHTPNFEAAKCWAGNMAKTATHAVVYAQLYTNDRKYHGLNAFVVPLRNPKTMLTYPGVTIGDLGEKISLNGIDNGFLIFDNYKIPKENFLSRYGNVDDAGNFNSQFKDPKALMAKSLVAVSGGRVSICEIAASYGTRAITIAIRYSAARKQFGPDNSDIEYPVLEYQAQQYRLLPHLASVYALKFFATWIVKESYDIKTGKESDASLAEMHVVSSATKPVCSWIVRDLIQECREACGGHGYLKCSQLGDLRNEQESSCTYEGENNVLLQQASNFLIATRAKGFKNFSKLSPLDSFGFLADVEKINQMKFMWKEPEIALEPENLLQTFNWICVNLLEKCYEKVKQLKSEGQTTFDTRNNSQVFYAINLAVAYGQRTIFNTFYSEIKNLNHSPEKNVLVRLLSLFGASLIVKNYLGILYDGGYIAEGINAGDLYQTGILKLLSAVKNDSISLIDAIAPSDFIVNSPLGMSDGKVYEHLKSILYQTPEAFERPKWWQDIVRRDYLKGKM